LLIASSYFYMVFIPWYILILLFVIAVDYFAAIGIEKAHGKKRKWLLIVSLTANIGILVVFKYYNFLTDNLTALFHSLGIGYSIPYLSLLLPIGLSFHTFQAMAYTIEVYRGNQKAERHIGIYALYVLFYPQLVAGPIERPQNLIPQLYQEHNFDHEQFKSGLLKMAWGFFKKVVIADRLSLVVDNAYNNAGMQNSTTLLIATLFFSFQIYCDFSGYSDIAIGAARVMGIRLMENFRTPYFSKSITEFWQRWHISLSSWFRDYVYIPLGGNRVSASRWWFNIIFVFIISGLWHGAKWTFIVWGLFHGFCVLMESIKNKWMPELKFNKYIQAGLTFLLVSFGWIFFRSNNLTDAKGIIGSLFSFAKYQIPQFPINHAEVIFSCLLIGILMAKEKWNIQLTTKRDALFYPCFITLVLSCYLFGIFNYKQFIYFQF